MSMISDLSELQESTDDFYGRMKKFLYSDIDCPSYLDGKASWMLPQSDSNLQLIQRLKTGVYSMHRLLPEHAEFRSEGNKQATEWYDY